MEQTPDAPAAPRNRPPVAAEDRLVMVQGGSGRRRHHAAAAPLGPSTTPYVAPAARPATLPFTGAPTDVLLPLGVGLLLAGGLATAGGRRRA